MITALTCDARDQYNAFVTGGAYGMLVWSGSGQPYMIFDSVNTNVLQGTMNVYHLG